MKNLAFLGLGAIGFPIAEKLIQHGFHLYTSVHSPRSFERAQNLGIEIVESPAELSRHADTVLVLVNNYAQCKDCLFAENGLLSTLKSGTVILSSTLDPRQAKELEENFPQGVHYLDAPISGGVTGALAGTLVTMVSGEKNVFDSCADIFAAYSKKAVYVGEEVGQAQALKAVNQMLVSIHMVATSEAFSLASGLGINPEILLDIIPECAGNSNIFQNRMPKLIANDFSARASLKTLEKDTGICMDLAKMVHVPSYLTSLCHELLCATPSEDRAAEDACAVIRMYLLSDQGDCLPK